MGRLRSGESIVSELLRNGKPVWPPPPPVKTVGRPPTKGARNRKRDAPPSYGNTESNVPSPTKKKHKAIVISNESESHGSHKSGSCRSESESRASRESESRRNNESESRSSSKSGSCRRNESGSQSSRKSESRRSNESESHRSNESESCNGCESKSGSSSKSESHRSSESESRRRSGSESDTALVDEAESGLLSRLCRYPSTKFQKNMRSSRLNQCKTSEAESVRKALISDLTLKGNLDAESMIDEANEAFASLSSFNYDFADLYNVVRDYISYNCQLSEAKKELESQGSVQEMIGRQNNLLARSNNEVKALIGAKTSLAKARESTASLEVWVRETRELLKELEEKLAQGNMEINTLQDECDDLEVTYEITKSEQQKIAKEMEENQNMAQEIRARCDKAKDGIERSKARLSSLC